MGNCAGKKAAKDVDSQRTARLHRLKTMRPFVLDNSLRETAVAQIRGHTIEDKDAILEAIMRTGMEDILVGAFGDLSNVDEEWLTILQQRGEIRPNFTVFSNLIDQYCGNPPLLKSTPAGIDAAIKYGVRNIVLEVDLAWGSYQTLPVAFPEYLRICRYPRTVRDLMFIPDQSHL